jgi:hypothetical protein
MISKSTPRDNPPSREESCRGKLHPAARKGIAEYNAGEYFEAHEDLEQAWMETGEPERRLYQGILQIGVGYYHIQQGNYPGALKMFGKARRWLEPIPSPCRGVDIKQLLEDADRVEAALCSLGEERIDAFDQTLFKPVPLA